MKLVPKGSEKSGTRAEKGGEKEKEKEGGEEGWVGQRGRWVELVLQIRGSEAWLPMSPCHADLYMNYQPTAETI